MTALVELRRYRLHPGRRDELIELFLRELVETQEADGLQVLACFQDTGEADHFVWLRGFATDDPQERADALAAFYDGRTWAKHANAANATMLDSDDVLLLRPLSPLPALGDTAMTTCLLSRALTAAEERALAAELPDTAAVLVTAAVENRFPRLPVRDEHAAAWFGACAAPALLAPMLTCTPLSQPSRRTTARRTIPGSQLQLACGGRQGGGGRRAHRYPLASAARPGSWISTR